MRITPIENPTSILLKIAYWMTKRQYGKVISPLKVIYARRTPLMFFGKKIMDIEKKLGLNKADKVLIRNYVSSINNCSFCSDLAKYEAAKNDVENQKLIELLNYRDSDNFTSKEKSLLAYIEEVSTMKDATDETFAELKNNYSDEEIIDITWICATENYFNLMAKPLGVKSDGLAK